MKNSFLLLFIVLIVGCSEPVPRKPVVRKTSTFLKESIERNKVINKLEEEELLRIIKGDSANTYIASPNGFWYYYKNKDSLTSKLPAKGDKVTYQYKIETIYDELLYDEKELGERVYIVEKQELITGLQDGIKLMKEGEKVVFLFPSHKAYGYSGYKKIGGNQPLKYTVTLKKIESEK